MSGERVAAAGAGRMGQGLAVVFAYAGHPVQLNEAARMTEEGVASAEDIDKATKFGFGFRFAILGMLEFIDWGGGDILYYASKSMVEATGDERFAAPKIVSDNMAAGRIGLRTREGFLDYSDMDVPAYQKQRLTAFVDMLRHMELLKPPQ